MHLRLDIETTSSLIQEAEHPPFTFGELYACHGQGSVPVPSVYHV